MQIYRARRARMGKKPRKGPLNFCPRCPALPLWRHAERVAGMAAKDLPAIAARIGGQPTMALAGDCAGAAGALLYGRVRRPRLELAARGIG